MKRTYKQILHNLRAKLTLSIVMIAIGTFTVFAAANTYEVVAKKDLPLSNVITSIALTRSPTLNSSYQSALRSEFNVGSFGIPKKMKLSETKQHLDINAARYSTAGWIASAGQAQTFITADQQQKIFGNAVIYLRYNTSTTQYLGDVLNGDIINIVTTEGWQLGYRVDSVGSDPNDIRSNATATSKILVIMVDDETAKIKSFSGTLTKVGARI
jgi:hypothetical protein